MVRGSRKSDREVLGTTLPLFPLFYGSVLLPGGFIRLEVDSKGASVVQDILRKQTEASSADVAAVPVLGSPHASSASHSPRDGCEDDAELDLDMVHGVGVAARIQQMQRHPSGTWLLTLEGRCRVAVKEVTAGSRAGLYVASVRQLDYFKGGAGATAVTKEQEQLMKALLRGVRRLLAAAQGQPLQGDVGLRTIRMLQTYGPALGSDVVGSLVAKTHPERLALLSATDVPQRLRLVTAMLERTLASAAAAGSSPAPTFGPLSSIIRPFVPDAAIGNGPRQPAAGRQGAAGASSSTAGAGKAASGGDSDDDVEGEAEAGDEARAIMRRLRAAAPPQEVLQAARREYRRLRRTNEQNPGYASSLAYLETLAALPWRKRSTSVPPPALAIAGQGCFAPPPGGELSLAAVRAQLDADHYGLDKVKDRIMQYVAVQRLRGHDAHAPILCLVGPPGVGKTSLAQSIAVILRRSFQRISLGGVRDEAEIRGHRRTYVGALPGRVLQALRRAGVSDPVILLDEVDKIGKDARGDPAAALLEVLDPEQNSAFVDTYLGLPVDLSGVAFVATANGAGAGDIPAPLLDRMEVVNLGAYTAEERVHIAARHLVPRVLRDHGISPSQLLFPEDALRLMVEGYTREAGVRSLGRCLDAVCRHVAVQLVTEREEAAAAAGGGAALPVAAPDAAGSVQPQLDATVEVEGLSAGADAPHAQAGTLPVAGEPVGTRLASLVGSERQMPSTASDMQHGAALSPPAAGGLRLLGPGSMELVTPPAIAVRPATALANAAQQAHPALGQALQSDPLPSGHVHPQAGAPQAAQLQPQLQARASSAESPVVVDATLIETVLGPRRYLGPDASHRVASPGSAAGLVWTAAGGQVQFIECLCVGLGSDDRPGELTLTGQLGEVLGESARIAVSWARAHTAALDLPPGPACPARRWDVHIHFPEGAVPKDGPSAGVTLAVALVSLFTGRCVRSDVALTGELTLRGHVLPVGGVREKVLAAHAAGMTRVVLPARCLPEVEASVPAEVRAEVEVVGVERLEQALAAAFDPPLRLQKGALAAGYPRL